MYQPLQTITRCSALGVMVSRFKCNLQLATCVANFVLALGHWTSSNPEALNKRACVKCALLQAWHHCHPHILVNGDFLHLNGKNGHTLATGALWQKYSGASIQVHGCAFFFVAFLLSLDVKLPHKSNIHKHIQRATTRTLRANTVSRCTEMCTAINTYIHTTKAIHNYADGKSLHDDVHALWVDDTFSVNYFFQEHSRICDHYLCSAHSSPFLVTSVHEPLVSVPLIISDHTLECQNGMNLHKHQHSVTISCRFYDMKL